MAKVCSICGNSGRYEIGRHERGYFIVESFTCPCRGEDRLIERNYFAQSGGIDLLTTFAALTLFSILML